MPIPGQPSINLTWIQCSWIPSLNTSVEYYLIELIPMIADSVTGEPIPRTELKTTAKTERDLTTGNIPTEYTFHNLQPNVFYRTQVAAVDRYGNISTVLTQEIVSGGNFPVLTDADIAFGNIQTQLFGALISWNANNAVENRIQYYQVFSDTEPFTDLTSDRLKYEGIATQTFIPANTIVYIKLRAVDIMGRPSSVLSISIDATPAPDTDTPPVVN